MPFFDENNRYTVACGIADALLIPSMVVAPYPRSRKRARAAASTSRRASRVRACGAADLTSAMDGIELLASLRGRFADVQIDGRADEGLERRLVELRTLDDVDRPPRARIEAGVEEAVGVVE